MNATNAKKLVSIALESLGARIAHASDKLAQGDTTMQNQIDFLGKMKKRTEASAKAIESSAFDYATLKALFVSTATADNKAPDYVAQYVYEKVLKAIDYSAGAELRLDKYSSAIVANALLNAGKISARGADRSLIRFLNDDALADNSDIVRYCARVEASTASTQKSSTRQMLRMLGLATCTKKTRAEDIQLTELGLSVFGSLIK